MLDRVASHLASAAGVTTTTDLGCIFRSAVGHNDCEISVSVETFRGAFYFRVAATHSRGRSFRKTRVVKWPYSRDNGHDLDAVVADLAAVKNIASGTPVTDARTGLRRWFDGLTGRTYYGLYRFASPLPGDKPFEITAETAMSGKELIVSLKESQPGHGFIIATLPHEAFAALRAAAERLRG